MEESKDWHGFFVATSHIEFGRGNFKVTFTPSKGIMSEQPMASGSPLERSPVEVLMRLDPEIDVAEFHSSNNMLGLSKHDFIGKATELAQAEKQSRK
jgi:hypothetical protein